MEKLFHHLVRGIIIRDDKILIAQAKGHINTFLPGGHIEFGESAKVALKRELNEELGANCNVGRFLGIVEHKWEKDGMLHCEINQVFEVQSKELLTSHNPMSYESHLEFLWCSGKELDEKNLQPFPFRNLIQQFLLGKEDVWWDTTLNIDSNDSTKS
ncbi:NUDIX domain-containing protein [Bacillus salitolerans]|uniref:NUDIX domain-containing protein n=1 Tax=Bacillus salitolerans TaxID=1437434 RepID=A0ABW4LMI0_9BACI